MMIGIIMEYKVISSDIDCYDKPNLFTGKIIDSKSNGDIINLDKTNLISGNYTWGIYQDSNYPELSVYIPIKDNNSNDIYLIPIVENEINLIGGLEPVSITVEPGIYEIIVSSLHIRSGPSLSAPIVGKYVKGQQINLVNYFNIADGMIWGKFYTSGRFERYIAVRNTNGKVYAKRI